MADSSSLVARLLAGPNDVRLPAQVRRFIACAEAYLSAGRRYIDGELAAQTAARAGRDAAGLNAVLPQWYAAAKDARRAILDAVEPLAQSLDAVGIDTFGLRRFRNAVESPEGLSAAKPLWLDLKTTLQQIAARFDAQATGAEQNAGNAALPTAKTGQGEADRGAGSTPGQAAAVSGADRETALRQLKPAVRKAYLAFQYAETMNERRLKDREAYDWLREHGIDPEKGDLGELTDYQVPAFGTFTRYCSEGRRALDERKYTPRAGRKTGPSIVRRHEIERRRGNDD